MIMYINTSSYSMHQKIPFSVYGENLIILCQNIVIIFLMWSYNKSISTLEKLAVVAFFATYSFLLFGDTLLTEQHWAIIAQSNIMVCKSYSLTLIELILIIVSSDYVSYSSDPNQLHEQVHWSSCLCLLLP